MKTIEWYTRDALKAVSAYIRKLFRVKKRNSIHTEKSGTVTLKPQMEEMREEAIKTENKYI